MFKLFVAAPTFQELRIKLLEAANSINVQFDEAEVTVRHEVEEPEMNEDDVLDNQLPAGPIGDVDAKGFPWDGRIHASSKTVTKDGSWRYRRGVDDDEIRKVETELKSKMAAVPAFNQPPIPQPVISPVPPVMPLVDQAPVPVAAPVQPVMQQPAPQQPAAQPMYDNIHVPPAATKPAHTLDTFRANLIPVLAALVQAGQITQAYLEQLKEYFGVKEIWQVMGDEKKVNELFENFVAAGLITKVG